MTGRGMGLNIKATMIVDPPRATAIGAPIKTKTKNMPMRIKISILSRRQTPPPSILTCSGGSSVVGSFSASTIRMMYLSENAPMASGTMA